MLASQIPAKFPIPFAASAGIGQIRTIPTASQISITPGAASLTDGFPPLNFIPVPAGGVPPFGQDMNGILNEITANQRWLHAGGLPVFDSVFSTAIGGYPNGAVLRMTNSAGLWMSIADNNTTNPDAGGAGWIAFAAANGTDYADATGTVDAIAASYPYQSSTLVDGYSLKVGTSGLNTITNPTFTPTLGGATQTARTIYKWVGGVAVALAAGDIQGVAWLVYDLPNTRWILMNPGRALGNFAGFSSVTAPATLTAAQIGLLLEVAAGTGALTLPLASSLPAGAVYSLWNFAGTSISIARSGADVIYYGNTNSTSATLGVGESITLTNSGAFWVISGGNSSLALSGSASGSAFGNSLAVSGYQKLPSGMIVQWGSFTASASADVAVTFPIAFPTAARQVLTNSLSVTGMNVSGYNSLSTTGFNGNNWTAAATRAVATVSYLAIGY